jgi:hypothetical protein
VLLEGLFGMIRIDLAQPPTKISTIERARLATGLRNLADELEGGRLPENQVHIALTYPWPRIDDVTPEEWRSWNSYQRNAFWVAWRWQGVLAHSCLGCGYPTAYGQSSCEACPDEKAYSA